MTPIVFIDTETTSLRPDRKAWEVAMIRRADHDDVGDETSSFIDTDDIDLPNADPFALNVGRFWDRHPQALLDQKLCEVGASYSVHDFRDKSLWSTLDGEVLGAYQAAQVVQLWTHGAHLVGAVPNFDAEVLAALLRDNFLTPTWHYHLVDVENLAVGWLAGREPKPVLPPWKSDDLTRLLGVEPASEQERHTALGDARWAARIYDKVMGA